MKKLLPLLFLPAILSQAQEPLVLSRVHTNMIPVVQSPDIATARTNIGATVQVNDYTTPGTYTWTKPAGAKLIRVQLISGGGGGGSGAKYPSGTATSGGAGGGGGGYSETVFVASDVPDSVTVRVGVGGSGGASVTNNATAGNAGTSGGQTEFDQLFKCRPPAGGGGGVSGASSIAGSPGGGTLAGLTGGAGASGAAGNAAVAQLASTACGGGGAGGGISSATEYKVGATGSILAARGFGWVNSVAPTLDGQDGGSASNQVMCSTGGSGGSSSVLGNGGNGGNGGNYGGGGGGGGSALDGVGNSGAGGNGAGGRAIITSYF